MAMQRLSRFQKRILGWLAADAQRTKGMILRSHEDLVRAVPGDKGNISHSLQTPEAHGWSVMGVPLGGRRNISPSPLKAVKEPQKRGKVVHKG